jgi:hypothetical protein
MSLGGPEKNRLALAVLMGFIALAGSALPLVPSAQESPTQEGFQALLGDCVQREGYEMISATSSEWNSAPWPWFVRLSEGVDRLGGRTMTGHFRSDGVTQYGVYLDHAPALSIDALCYKSRIIRLVIHHPRSKTDNAKSLSLALQKICPSVLMLAEPG